jgi:hypothetical protein
MLKYFKLQKAKQLSKVSKIFLGLKNCVEILKSLRPIIQ